MGNIFHPVYAFTDVWHIPRDFFSVNHIRYLILDIDNTLVADNQPEPDENARLFLKRLDMEGIQYCFVSNNHKERVEAFNAEFQRPYIYRAKKPLPFGLWNGLKKLNAPKAESAFIGDQLLTDMLAGNLGGITTILVNPVNEKKETKFFRMKRAIERRLYTRIIE